MDGRVTPAVIAANEELNRFLINGANSARSIGELGSGSYGTVHEVDVNGQVYAGKVIHETLLSAHSEPRSVIESKYVQECHLMSVLDHPNITNFVGVCYLPSLSSLPVLLMEKLEQSLDDFLENTADISFEIKRSILKDIARGLVYLHSRDPPILHRDLTARNVLLTTDHVAKVTDFGNSRLVPQTGLLLTHYPGTLVYMPPEASTTRYDSSLDIFSFGHLALFTTLQIFPGDLLPASFPDPRRRGEVIGRTEVSRRESYFDQFENHDQFPGGKSHPLVLLMKRCLDNNPSERYTAEGLLSALETLDITDDPNLREAVQHWNESAQRSEPVVLVLAGKAGVGKSTLLNNFLGLEHCSEAAAKTKRSGRSVTTDVAEYVERINGVTVKIIDTPGLEAADLSEEQVKRAIAMVNAYTDGKADLLFYCASMLGGRLDQGDINIIKTLNRAFHKKIWERSLLILTHADLVMEDIDAESQQDRLKELDTVVEDFCGAFQGILKSAGVTSVKKVQSGLLLKEDSVLSADVTTIVAMPSGKTPKKEPAGWKSSLFVEVLKRCDIDAIPALLELQGIKWMEFAHNLHVWSKESLTWKFVYGATSVTVGAASEIAAKFTKGTPLERFPSLAMQYSAVIQARAEVKQIRKKDGAVSAT